VSGGWFAGEGLEIRISKRVGVGEQWAVLARHVAFLPSYIYAVVYCE
jgi:hypothetical protein